MNNKVNVPISPLGSGSSSTPAFPSAAGGFGGAGATAGAGPRVGAGAVGAGGAGTATGTDDLDPLSEEGARAIYWRKRNQKVIEDTTKLEDMSRALARKRWVSA